MEQYGTCRAGSASCKPRGFEGAFFDQDAVIAKFPKTAKEPGAVCRLDTSTHEIKGLYPVSGIPEDDDANFLVRLAGTHAWQLGEFLVKSSRQAPDKKIGNRFLMEVLDVRTNKKLWDRKFDYDRPHPFYAQSGNTLTMLLDTYESVKAEVKDDPPRQRQV